jgi:hypothetical protein
MKVYQCDKCGYTTETTIKGWLSITSDGFGKIINGFTDRKIVEQKSAALDLHFCYPKCFFSYFQQEKTFVIKNPEYKIVCICGSSRFKEEIIKVRKSLTEQGYIVLSPEIFVHAGDDVSEQCKERLDALHFKKIHIADFIYVVDKEKTITDIGLTHIGESTSREIELAVHLGKSVYYHSKVDLDIFCTNIKL